MLKFPSQAIVILQPFSILIFLAFTFLTMSLKIDDEAKQISPNPSHAWHEIIDQPSSSPQMLSIQFINDEVKPILLAITSAVNNGTFPMVSR